jgi:hypothetical protein
MRFHFSFQDFSGNATFSTERVKQVYAYNPVHNGSLIFISSFSLESKDKFLLPLSLLYSY